MKAGGPFNAMIERHNERAIEDDTTFGYMIACVGTKRVSYWAMDGGWTYDEYQARAWPSKNDAGKFMASETGDLFKYCRLVRVDGSVNFLKGGRVPTVNGY